MNRSTRRLAQKVVALILIAAVLQLVGLAPPLIIFIVGAGCVVSYAARRSERKETHRLFKFYVVAYEVLSDEQREWYRFEVIDLVDEGDYLVHSMPDAPPLCHFTVGALAFRLKEFATAAEHLKQALDESVIAQQQYANPSPQLRRYVEFLRTIERNPMQWPTIVDALTGLERMRFEDGPAMLLHSQNCIDTSAPLQSESLIAGPHPTIKDVLHEVYSDEQKAC
jgi:hypothetical protein